MAKARRKPPSKALKRKYARNRVRRTVIKGQIERISSEIETAMRKLRAGGVKGAALAKLEQKVLDLTEQRSDLQAEHDSLSVRRKPRSGRGRRSSGGVRST